MSKIYCKADRTYHYTSELYSGARSFVNYTFSSGERTGNDFKSFNTKFRNAIKKSLPEGYEIAKWTKGHYYCSAFIKNNNNQYIYMSINDVRYCPNGWITDILIRTVKDEKDFTGGPNNCTSLFTFTNDIKKLYR